MAVIELLQPLIRTHKILYIYIYIYIYIRAEMNIRIVWAFARL